jgi:hypothetical protein
MGNTYIKLSGINFVDFSQKILKKSFSDMEGEPKEIRLKTEA